MIKQPTTTSTPKTQFLKKDTVPTTLTTKMIKKPTTLETPKTNIIKQPITPKILKTQFFKKDKPRFRSASKQGPSPFSCNEVLAGYMAHEYLMKGTIMGKSHDQTSGSKVEKESMQKKYKRKSRTTERSFQCFYSLKAFNLVFDFTSSPMALTLHVPISLCFSFSKNKTYQFLFSLSLCFSLLLYKLQPQPFTHLNSLINYVGKFFFLVIYSSV
ncbi:hypothetical protein RJT34_18879 [Clitoria ternatea]|uniref:Uncharacterized protein n=1 Tax=Clitoria ternatea TaxID=43366 RepID=A0AAN9IQF4_CLITE